MKIVSRPTVLLTTTFTKSHNCKLRIVVKKRLPFSCFVSDLQPGRMYTVFVSTASAITDQIPDEQFAIISAAQGASTTGSSGAQTNVGAIVGAVVVVLAFIIGASISVMLFLIW